MRSLIKHPVLIVDDHPIVRRGLKEVINETADLEVCGEAANVPEALRQVDTTQPHAVIVNITLGDEDGIELIDYIRSRWPSMKILVSSAHDEETFAGRVLRAGALGFISKREPLGQVVEAVRQVLRGEVYLSPHMATRLLRLAAVGKSLDHDPVQALSNRELQVFEKIGEGLNTREIAPAGDQPEDGGIAPQGHQDEAGRADHRAAEPPGLPVGPGEPLATFEN